MPGCGRLDCPIDHLLSLSDSHGREHDAPPIEWASPGSLVSPFSPSWLGAATHLAVSIRQFWGCAMVDCAPVGGGQGTRFGPPEVKAAGDALQQMQKNVASETDTAGFSGIQPLPNTRQMGLTPSPPRFTLDRDELALVVAPTPSTRSGPALGGRLAALFSIRLVESGIDSTHQKDRVRETNVLARQPRTNEKPVGKRPLRLDSGTATENRTND
jgi:hypothetical protein